MRILQLALLCSLCLSGCAWFQPPAPAGSWVMSGLDTDDSDAVANAIVGIVRATLPPAHSTIWLGSQERISLVSDKVPVEAGLRHAGYGVSETETQGESDHRVRYFVTTVGNGMVLVRVVIDRKTITQGFGHRDGHLAAVTAQSAVVWEGK